MSNRETADLPKLADNVAKDLVNLFKLFSDETRLRIIHYLMQRDESNVRTLCDMLGQSQPAVSHHLALLRVKGLVTCRREGKHNFYRVVSKKFEQFVQMIFAASPQHDGQISFDTFALSFKPTTKSKH